MTLVNRTAIFHNARYRQHLPILAAAKFYRFGALGKYGHLADGCSFPVTAPERSAICRLIKFAELSLSFSVSIQYLDLVSAKISVIPADPGVWGATERPKQLGLCHWKSVRD